MTAIIPTPAKVTDRVLFASTVAAAKALTTKRDGDTVVTQGYSVAGLGGNEYIYHESGRSEITTDLGWYIAGSGADDYFEAKEKVEADPRQFGAVGDGETDDTAAIQSALDTSTVVRFKKPTSQYLVSNLKLNNDQHVIGPGRKVPCILGDGTDAVFRPVNLGQVTAIDTATDRLTVVGHEISDSTAVRLYSFGVFPSPVTRHQGLYTKSIDSDTLELYTDSGLTSKVNFTTTGSGYIALYAAAGPIRDITLTGLNVSSPGQKCYEGYISPDFEISDCSFTSSGGSDAVDIHYSWRITVKDSSIHGSGVDVGTFTVDTGTDRLTCSNHGLTDGDEVCVSSSSGSRWNGTAPSPIDQALTYFAKVIDTNTVELYEEAALSNKVDITDTGTGTHTLSKVYTAFRLIDNGNGLWLVGNTMSGGSAGRTVIIEQSQAINLMDNVMESGLHGVWISSTDYPGKGNCNGVNIKGNYFEQIATPLVLAKNSTIFGADVSNNWFGNAATSVIVPRDATFTMGRIQESAIHHNSIWADDASESLYKIQLAATSGGFGNTSPQEGLSVYDNALNELSGDPQQTLEFSGTNANNESAQRILGGYGYYQFANNYDSHGTRHLRDWVSPVVSCAHGMGIRTWLPGSILTFGGKVFSVEVFDVCGTLTAATIQVGRPTAPAETVSYDVSNLVDAAGVNFATSDVNTSTDQITSVAHGLVDGDRVAFTTTDTLPDGLSTAYSYYVEKVDDDTFSVHLTSALNAAINLTTQGVGTHTFVKQTIVYRAAYSIPLVTTSPSIWRTRDNMTRVVGAGTGTGTFRYRIRYRAN